MDQSTSLSDSQFDFATLLEESCDEMESVHRGDLLNGTVLATDDYGLIVDVGLKRDGVVPRSDLEQLGKVHTYSVGDHVIVMVIQPEDRDGNLLVSIHQARASKDWQMAADHMAHGDLYSGQVVAANRGGVIVPYGDLRGFVPASHVANLPRGLDDEKRKERLSELVGRELTLKIIEVNPRRRRLVLSEREAQRESREQAKHQLLADLNEGDVVKGTVSGMRDFGAFVDLGGADGLIHVSELAWRRVKHPSEVVQIGDEVEVYILRLDREGRRIGLSLKRLHPNPWSTAEEDYCVEQLVEGTVSRVVSFGAFVELESGIEALLHVSQMGDPPPSDPVEVVYPGQRLVSQIISLEPQRQRMGLSLKNVGEGQHRHEPAPLERASLPDDDRDIPVHSDEAVVETEVQLSEALD